MRKRTIKWLFFFFVVSSMPVTPAIAEESACPAEDPAKYCWCIYEQTLDDMKEMQGNTHATIKQRVSAAKKALEQCLTRSTDRVTDDIKSK